MSDDTNDKGAGMKDEKVIEAVNNEGCACRQCDPRGMSTVRWYVTLIAALSSAAEAGHSLESGGTAGYMIWGTISIVFGVTLREGRKP